MTDLIDTLHPESNPSDNIYPNIKKANIPSEAVDASKLAANAVTTAKINDGAVTQDKIRNGAVNGNKLAVTITGTHIFTDTTYMYDIRGERDEELRISDDQHYSDITIYSRDDGISINTEAEDDGGSSSISLSGNNIRMRSNGKNVVSIANDDTDDSNHVTGRNTQLEGFYVDDPVNDTDIANKRYLDNSEVDLLFDLAGKTPSIVDDNTTAYQKVVPTGATRAKIKSIGGMSYKSNNLANNPTINNNVSNNFDPIIVIPNLNLIANQSYTISFTNVNTLASGCRYYITADNGSISYTYTGANSSKTEYSMTFTPTSNETTIRIRLQYNEDTTKNSGTTTNVMLNSGSTALPYEPYFGGIRDSIVTKVYSRKAALKDLRFTQIGYVDLGTLNYTKHSSVNSLWFGSASNIGIKAVANNVKANIVCDNYTTMAYYTNGTNDGYSTNMSISFNNNNTSIAINDSNLTGKTSEQVKTYLNGKIVYFELATEVETPSQAVIDYFVIDTFTIPEEVKALEGYGRGINSSVYNVLDLETKVFTDKDSIGDLGTLNYTMYSVDEGNLFRTNQLTNAVKMATLNLLVDGYTPVLRVNRANKTIYSSEILTNTIDIINNDYSTAEAFKTAMNGVDLQYELATYNTTNVSQYITNNVIEVEAGGYLVFENQYGQAVPSNITYLTGLDNLDDLYVKKVTSATNVMQAYVKLDNGTNQMLDVHWNNIRDTIAIRDQTGNIRVAATPTVDTHATSKKYINDNYQPKLVSGTNIKTINNQSILGSGNIDIQGGGGTTYTAGDNIDITNNVISLDDDIAVGSLKVGAQELTEITEGAIWLEAKGNFELDDGEYDAVAYIDDFGVYIESKQTFDEDMYRSAIALNDGDLEIQQEITVNGDTTSDSITFFGHYAVFFGTLDCTNFVGLIKHRYTAAEINEINNLDFDIADPTDPADQAQLKRGLRILHDMISSYALPSYGYNGNQQYYHGGRRYNLFWEVENQDMYIQLQDSFNGATTHYTISLTITDLSVTPTVEKTRLSYELTDDVLTVTKYDAYPILKIQSLL